MSRVLSLVSCSLVMLAVAGGSQDAWAKSSSGNSIKQRQHQQHRLSSMTKARKFTNNGQAVKNLNGRARKHHTASFSGAKHRRHHFTSAKTNARKFNNSGRVGKNRVGNVRRHKHGKSTVMPTNPMPTPTTK